MVASTTPTQPNMGKCVRKAVYILLIFLFWMETYLVMFPYKTKYVDLGDSIYPIYGLASAEHYTFDPKTGYSLIPHIKDDKQLITTDEYGFRTTKKYDPNLESIIFVGDSTVFGWGVKDSVTFPYKIATDYNVINMGVPAYSVAHIKEVLTKKVPKFNPKIVFVSILWPWKPFDSYSNEDAWKEIDIFPKKTCRWVKLTRKDARHY